MKKRLVLFGCMGMLLLALAGCSNPKRDAVDTHVQLEMENGTLDRS